MQAGGGEPPRGHCGRRISQGSGPAGRVDRCRGVFVQVHGRDGLHGFHEFRGVGPIAAAAVQVPLVLHQKQGGGLRSGEGGGGVGSPSHCPGKPESAARAEGGTWLIRINTRLERQGKAPWQPMGRRSQTQNDPMS